MGFHGGEAGRAEEGGEVMTPKREATAEACIAYVQALRELDAERSSFAETIGYYERKVSKAQDAAYDALDAMEGAK